MQKRVGHGSGAFLPRRGSHMKFSTVTKFGQSLACLGILAGRVQLCCSIPDSSQASETNASTTVIKKPAPRSHRVLTNDDIPSRTPGNSTPEIEARLQQLNLCDRACFAQVFKDRRWPSANAITIRYPFSDKDDHGRSRRHPGPHGPRFAAIRSGKPCCETH